MTQPQPDAWDELRAAQHEEYSQWIANGPIYVGGALAYNEGDPVPASNVKAHAYDKNGLVSKRGGSKSTSSPATATGGSNK